MPFDKKNELFYLIDEKDNIISSITRGEAHSDKSKIHRSVGVFIINENDEMLMQKRSQHKDMNAGEWSYAVGGHVNFGNTYEQTANIELEEELGINAKLQFITKTLVRMKNETEYKYYYQAKVSSNKKIYPDYIEIELVKWIKLKDLSKFINKHKAPDWVSYGLKACKFI